MYGTVFIFICCSCMQPGLMQTLSWDLVTPPTINFTQQVELRCTITGAVCCSNFSRVWTKGPTLIISDGSTLLPAKYSEIVNAANNWFSLIISNLDKDDVDVNYKCSYLNDSPSKTLTHNHSFEYHPSEPCPVKIENGELVGTLNVAMSTPYPSVFAQYGDSNFTSYLTTTIAQVPSSPKFYTIKSSIKKTVSKCSINERFMLSVLTGVTTTNICNNEDLCKCGECAGKCFGWAMLGTTVVDIVILIVLAPKIVLHFILICVTFGLYLLYLWRKKPDVTDKKENSANSDPEPVYGNYGSTITFKCTFKATQSTSIRWSYVNGTRKDAVAISDGRSIATTNPSHARVSIDREYNLTLSGLQKSDEVVYRCNFGMKQKEYRLELLDKNHDQDHAAHAEKASNFDKAHHVQHPVTDAASKDKNYDQDHAADGENGSNFGPAVLCCFLLCVFTCGLILLCYKPGREAYSIMKKILTVQVIFVISAILNGAVAVPICYILCPCFKGTDPAFIALGVGTCVIVAVIVLCCCMPVSDDINPCYILLCLLTFGLVCLLCKKPDMNPDDAEQMQLATRASGSGSKSDNGKSYEPVPKDSPDNQNK